MLFKAKKLIPALVCGFLISAIPQRGLKAQVINTVSLKKAEGNQNFPVPSASCPQPFPITINSQINIVQSLRKGGYIIYFRHTQTNPLQADTDTFHLDNIKAQRQLTLKGENQAIAIGQAFKALNIPVGEVLTSKFFRAQKVAILAGFQNFKPIIEITEPENVSPYESQKRAEGLRKLLFIKPKHGTNTVIISHRPNLQEALGKQYGDLKEGEAVIFQPQGENNGVTQVARISSPEAWTDMAKQFSSTDAQVSQSNSK